MNSWGRIVAFDLETTGVDVDTSRIVSACVAVLDADGDVVARWDWLADPGVDIPEGASRVHGITTERARAEGRPAATVVAEIAQALRVSFGLGMPVVVYNAPYDLSLLDRECRRHGVPVLDDLKPVIDPLVMDKAVDRYRKGKRTLEVTADRYGVDLSDAHDAGSDAIAAGLVAQALARAYPEELALDARDLHELQRGWYREQAERFQDYVRTTKGDSQFVANSEWPVRTTEYAVSFEDTQPIPAPRPRPSLTVPEIDIYTTGTLSLEAFARPRASAYATAPPPQSPPAYPRQPLEEIEAAPVAHPRHAEPLVLEVVPSTAPDTADTAETLPRVTPRRPTVLRVAAGIITDASGRTLVVRKRGTTAFMQAGGKIEPGESALAALTRELLEEIGLQLDPDATEYLGSFRAEAANEPNTVIRAEVFALVTDGVVAPSSEIEELVWLETLESPGIELAPLTRDTVLPLWEKRRSALF
ncbi:DNA polymerase III epsilon subunit-like protein/8-oxo-dGTP pyrophosphatase MutT (NUDIX family) [Leifsonia sp. AK011]|uniref:exonuclease domain-containing protein n=1 Tax=Leifsonia sp. AK011 TaxID=2723075 RepID=UPI0015CBB974|nr:exonuclease domain-containing protein [Leifsonia sp. AK011]NYF10689.1 DNA polymerase III epsilon subunit-like protein/8-oxo-dGTP pyrophosphatase MutT (NUDIX family) [Leifsonia sp. AK011]